MQDIVLNEMIIYSIIFVYSLFIFALPLMYLLCILNSYSSPIKAIKQQCTTSEDTIEELSTVKHEIFSNFFDGRLTLWTAAKARAVVCSI